MNHTIFLHRKFVKLMKIIIIAPMYELLPSLRSRLGTEEDACPSVPFIRILGEAQSVLPQGHADLAHASPTQSLPRESSHL
jgi:hypothetical protein